MNSRLLLYVLVLFSARLLHAAVWHVDTLGNDATGNGSSAKPWKTVAHACRSAQSGVIVLGGGTYVESTYIEVPPDISIRGMGRDTTIIRFTPVHKTDGAFYPEKFALLLRSSSRQATGQTLSGFTVDGNGRNLHGGVFVNKRDRVTVRGVGFRDINWCGLWLNDSDSSLVDSCVFSECGWESVGYASGSLHAGRVRDVTIKNTTITAYAKGTGYAIKDLYAASGSEKARWERVVITHCLIDLKEKGMWANYTAPNISIEVFALGGLRECEISYSKINTCISLPVITPSGCTIPTMRIHHNYFPIVGYGLELNLNNAEIDNNYIDGGSWFVSGFYNRTNNVRFHHNVFRNVPSVSDVGVFLIANVDTMYIYNNTFIRDDQWPGPGWIVVAGTNNRLVIQNNAVYMTDSYFNATNWKIGLFNPNRSGSTASILSLVVANNCLSKLVLDTARWPGLYRDNTAQNAGIRATGARPDPFSLPSGASSNLVDAGSGQGIPAIVYLGKAPDIGAYEYQPPTGVCMNSIRMLAASTSQTNVLSPPFYTLTGRKIPGRYLTDGTARAGMFVQPGINSMIVNRR